MSSLSQHAELSLPTPAQRPGADLVIYDSQCAFCRAQVARLARWDSRRRLAFLSLHDDQVVHRWPDLPRDELMRQMYVITPRGDRYGGARALRYLSTRIPRLWCLAPVMYLPGALTIAQAIYGWIARNRYRLLGEVPCQDACALSGDRAVEAPACRAPGLPPREEHTAEP